MYTKLGITIICLRNYYTIKLKDKLLACDINTEAIASDFRITKTARFNPYRQSYKVLSFRSYYYLNYDLITLVVEVPIEERKYLRSSDTIPTVHSQVPRLESPLYYFISYLNRKDYTNTKISDKSITMSENNTPRASGSRALTSRH